VEVAAEPALKIEEFQSLHLMQCNDAEMVRVEEKLTSSRAGVVVVTFKRLISALFALDAEQRGHHCRFNEHAGKLPQTASGDLISCAMQHSLELRCW